MKKKTSIPIPADPAMNSGNHLMQIGDLGVWMYEYLAGIRPDPEDPGFHHVVVKPYTPAGLNSVAASHRSMYRKISSAWRRENGAIELLVTIPANTRGTIWVRGTKAVASDSKPSRLDGDSMVFEVGSGSYSFRSQ